jgi:hypothetical protein
LKHSKVEERKGTPSLHATSEELKMKGNTPHDLLSTKTYQQLSCIRIASVESFAVSKKQADKIGHLDDVIMFAMILWQQPTDEREKVQEFHPEKDEEPKRKRSVRENATTK